MASQDALIFSFKAKGKLAGDYDIQLIGDFNQDNAISPEEYNRILENLRYFSGAFDRVTYRDSNGTYLKRISCFWSIWSNCLATC